MVNISTSSFTQPSANTSVVGNKMSVVGSEATNGPEYQGQDAQDTDSKGDDQARRVPYTMHGVLHYVQHEWSRYEMERAQWEMERAELQARISFLQGERKGQENLKADLIRRIKMLEYSLKQERAKNYRLTHNGQEPDTEQNTDDAHSEVDNQVPLDVDAYSGLCSSANSFREARALLRQYLQEIGYSEAILDVRSFRAKNLLGLVPPGDWPGTDGHSDSRQAAAKALQETDRAVMEVAQFLNKKKGDAPNHAATDDSESDDEDRLKKGGKDGLDPETVDALGEFSFLKEDKPSIGNAKKRVESSDEWSVNQSAINQMKEKFRSEQERKRSNSQSESNSSGKSSLHQMFRMGHDDVKRDVPADEIQQLFGGKSKKDYMDINTVLGIADETNIDIKDEFTAPDEDTTAIRWNLKFTLRSHFDSIRVMQFHPVEPVLVTASEDGTAKLWNLASSNPKSDTIKGAQVPSPSVAITELEPSYTFRGHNGPILSMDMSPTGDMCYTGGFDGVICCWSVPSVNTDIYDTYDAKVLTEKLKGHTDAVWSIAYHSSDNRIVSASADGTIRLWEPGKVYVLIS
uniref:Striatin N-terminal domain-containing protein n=1 Tax=Parascaris univalens TaxID=6257 RepID=A0A915C8E7_PARUN